MSLVISRVLKMALFIYFPPSFIDAFLWGDLPTSSHAITRSLTLLNKYLINKIIFFSTCTTLLKLSPQKYQLSPRHKTGSG